MQANKIFSIAVVSGKSAFISRCSRRHRETYIPTIVTTSRYFTMQIKDSTWPLLLELVEYPEGINPEARHHGLNKDNNILPHIANTKEVWLSKDIPSEKAAHETYCKSCDSGKISM